MASRRRKPSRMNWPLVSVFGGFVAFACCYLAITVILQFGGPYRVGDVVTARSMDLFAAGWFLWFGASVGSFLNVVAWRMPRGVSINGFSACPFCTTPIKWYDNLPVVGWLNLRGRCRSCRLPIAARYPIVEFLVGLSIALLGFGGLYLGGINQPYRVSPHAGHALLWTPYISVPVIAVNIYHIVALTGVWAFALVRIDGHGLPARLVAFFLAAAIIPMILWPAFQLVPFQMTTTSKWLAGGRMPALMFVITGLVAAIAIAQMVGRTVCPDADPKTNPLGKDTRRLIDLVWVFSIPGIVLGWHALIAVSTLSIVAAMVLRRKVPSRTGYQWLIASVPWSMALHIVFWKLLFKVPFWPAPDNAPAYYLAWGFAILVLSTDLREPEKTMISTAPTSEDDLDDDDDDLDDDDDDLDDDDDDDDAESTALEADSAP